MTPPTASQRQPAVFSRVHDASACCSRALPCLQERPSRVAPFGTMGALYTIVAHLTSRHISYLFWPCAWHMCVSNPFCALRTACRGATSRRVARSHPHAAEHHPSQPAHELPPFLQSHHRVLRPRTRVRFYETDPASKCSLAGDGMRESLSHLACNQFKS